MRKRLLKIIITSIICAIMIFLMIPRINVFAVDNEAARYLMDAETMSDGRIKVLFIKGGNSSSGVITDGTLYLGIYNPANNEYDEEPVGETSIIAKEASLALFENNAHIAYTTTDDKIAYIYQTENGWSNPEVFNSANANGDDVKTDALSSPDIAVDINGKIHVVYVDTDGAGDGDYHKPDGMYLTNKSGGFTISAVASCTGWKDAGVDYDTLVNPIKIAYANNCYNIAYKIHNYSTDGWGGKYNNYTIYFKAETESAYDMDTNSSGKVYEVCKDGTHNYTLISRDGKYVVFDGNSAITETENTTAIANADMTLYNSNIYYASISESNVALYQNGTFTDGKVANTPILSNHNKFVTVVSNGIQYILYTGSDKYKSLVITKYDNDELSEFKVLNTFTVTFETNGGTAVDSQIVVADEKAILPTEPTKEATANQRYEFAGWYKDQGLNNSFNFDTDIITSDITLYAKWNEIHVHTFEKTEAKAPTCVATGNNEYYTCTSCGKIFKDAEGTNETTLEAETIAIDNTAHSWNQGEVTTLATCTSEGVMTYTCEHDHSHTKTEPIQKIAHSMVHIDSVPATCMETGHNEYYKCTSCGDFFKDVQGTESTTQEAEILEIDDSAHTWNQGEITTPATCTEDGLMTYKYIHNSSHTKTDIIPKKGHSYITTSTVKKASLSQNGEKVVTKKCSICGNIESTNKTPIPYPKTISVSKTSFIYNKNVQKPTVKVVGSDGIVIDASNYTVIYSNNSSKKVGRYTVTITFKGNYEGSKSFNYDINPKGTSLSKVTAGKKQFTAKWKAQKTETTGYEIQYATNKSFTSGKKTVKIKKNKTTSSTVKKLKAKKKYYVKIRTYKTVNGKKFYSGWSKVLNVTTKK